MNYPIKTLSQLSLILKGFRKLRRLTQAAMAERLGITQQSYAYFEANPATATLERLFMVLRMLDVEISLDQAAAATSTGRIPPSKASAKRNPVVETAGKRMAKTARSVAIKKDRPSAARKPGRIIAATQKKESW